jgi:putative ABC transport system permease protein
MFKSYFKIALRNLRKQKVYSLINVLGLAAGMACFIIISLYVLHEYSFDKFHEKSGCIYRIVAEHKWYDQFNRIAVTSGPLAPALVRDFPEVTKATRFGSLYPALVSYREQHFYEGGVFYADSSIFDIFTFPLLNGNPQDALSRPFSAVITTEIAQKYFGEYDPLEKVLSIDKVGDFIVTAVMQKIPPKSHLQFNILLSFATLYHIKPDHVESWTNRSYLTYVLLRKDYRSEDFEAKLPAFLDKYTGQSQTRETDYVTLYLQGLEDIYLRSDFQFDLAVTGDAKYIYIFSAIAIFILLIACINFMNLSTARSLVRAKEVGVRKVMGGHRVQFVRQFLFESQLMSLIGLLLALVLVEFVLPTFNNIIAKDLHIDYRHHLVSILCAALGLSFLVGLVAGSYPAFFLSGLKSVNTLKGPAQTDASGFQRNGLVLFQFAITIALVIGVLVISNQLHYVRNRNLGMTSEQVIVVQLMGSSVQDRTDSFKSELLRHPNVIMASASSTVPVRSKQQHPFRTEGSDEKDRIWMNVYSVDADFIATLGLALVAGRNFSSQAGHATAGQAASGFILNKTAAETFGWEDPIGRRIYRKSSLGPIIGVVEDFHITSLHHNIEPVVLFMGPGNKRYVLTQIRPENIPETIAYLRNKWKEFEPNRPFTYAFLDEYFDQAYRSEERLSQILRSFSFLAIFIACLGLFGLAAFATERRTKEIGIRKVFGATVATVTALLSKDFVKLVLLANIIAWPIAWYAMHKWLQNFAYRINIGWWVFALAGGLALFIALLTVSAQAVRAALANPVEVLKHE